MSEEEKDIELLEKYLAESLSAEEKNAVDARLRGDESLKQALDDLKILKAGFREVGRRELKEHLSALENSLPKTNERKIIAFRPWAIGVAAAIVVAVVSYLLWPKPADPQELFGQYFEPYPNIIMPTVRGDLSVDSSLTAKAYRAYDLGEYTKAIEYFEQLEKKDEGVLLYLGNSYLASGDADKAIPVFEKVLNEYDAFDEQAGWYVALAHVKLGHIKVADSLLRGMQKGDSTRFVKAEDLIQKLKP